MRFASANPGLPVGRAVCSYGDCGACPSVKSPVAEVSGGVASAALLAAHQAFIAAASCARRSGERLSFLFALLAAPGFLASPVCDGDFFSIDVEDSPAPRAARARAADFLLAFIAFAASAAFS